jgi:pimeloyl-ACP methyl ester carboxylesterase
MCDVLIAFVKTLCVMGVIFVGIFTVLSLKVYNRNFRILRGMGSHLVVFCHGLGSVPYGMSEILNQFASLDPEGIKYTLFAPSCNRLLGGFINPVRIQAQNVFNELEELRLPQRFDKISIVGISLGGLVGTHLVSLLDEDAHWKSIKRVNLITVASPHLGIYPEPPTSIMSGLAFIVLTLRYYLSYLTPLSKDLRENIYTDTMKRKLCSFAHRIAYSPKGVDFAVPNHSSAFGVKRFKLDSHFDFEFGFHDTDFYEVRIIPVDDWIPFTNHNTISHCISLTGDFREGN